MSDKDMEKEIIDKGLTYPRITNDEIEEKMKEVKYSCHVVPGTTATAVTAYIVMGHINFTLAIEIMACVDPRNFNQELGEKYGIEKVEKSAKDKLWELEGYRLAYDISNTSKTEEEVLNEEFDFVFYKHQAVSDIIESEDFKKLSEIEQELLEDHLLVAGNYIEVICKRLGVLKGEHLREGFTYGKPKTFKDRLKIERKELGEKLSSLCTFLSSDDFEKLPVNQCDLLTEQSKIMTTYLAILDHRLSIL